MFSPGFATVGRDLGRVLQVYAVMPAATVVVALVWREFYAIPALLASAALPLAVGYGLAERYGDAADPGKLHGMVIAAGGWFLVAVFGALPFVLLAVTIQAGLLGAPALNDTVAAFCNPLNALFESMSGFTGTGLTMTVHEDRLPRVL